MSVANFSFFLPFRWIEELEKHQVFVMTYQVFTSVLEKGLLDMKQVNLLVLDECHNTVGDATLRDILSSCELSSESPKPRILGLTSSIVNDKCQPIKLSRIISSLENTLKSVIHTSNNVLSALQYVLYYFVYLKLTINKTFYSGIQHNRRN